MSDNARLNAKNHRGVPRNDGQGWRELEGARGPGAHRAAKGAGVRHPDDVPPATTTSGDHLRLRTKEEHPPTPTGTTTDRRPWGSVERGTEIYKVTVRD